jgi:hypothetical protein
MSAGAPVNEDIPLFVVGCKKIAFVVTLDEGLQEALYPFRKSSERHHVAKRLRLRGSLLLN